MENVEIFKECEDGKLTMEEVDLILQWTSKNFRFRNDRANGYIAFALADCDREDAENLVNCLNKKCGEDNWYLGARGEEYVFVD